MPRAPGAAEAGALPSRAGARAQSRSGDGVVTSGSAGAFIPRWWDGDVSDMSLVREHPPVFTTESICLFPTGRSTVVVIVFVLHHCTDQEQVIREAARVCRRSVLVIEDTYRNSSDLAWLRMMHAYLDKVEGMRSRNAGSGRPRAGRRCSAMRTEGCRGEGLAALHAAAAGQPIVRAGAATRSPRDPSCRRIENKEARPFRGRASLLYTTCLHSEITCGGEAEGPQVRSRAERA